MGIFQNYTEMREGMCPPGQLPVQKQGELDTD